MQTSLRGKIEIACHEGLSLQPYFDSVGVTTIGIGMTASEIPDLPNWPKTKSISVDEAFAQFDVALGKYEDAVNASITAGLVQEEFDSLVSLCYNIGTSGFKHSSLVEALNTFQPDEIVRKHFLMWDKPSEIYKRRLDETNLYSTCEYQTSGICEIIETGGTGHQKSVTHMNLLEYYHIS